MVHRRDHFRSEKILQDRLFKNPKIDVIWDTVLDDVQGAENPLKVNKVLLKNVKTGAITQKNIDGCLSRSATRPPPNCSPANSR